MLDQSVDLRTGRWADYVTHLRLHFQLLLSPVFLWGYLLAGGKVNVTLAIGYLAFHLFGYAGGTALNSYYDRDEGPIGGLAHPPPLPRHLLAFALIWQAIGFLLSLRVNASFAAIYLIMFCLSVAYSHPRLRWKGHPLLALLTVGLGQGVLACLGGWAVARGEILSAGSWLGAIGILTVTLLIVGFYPLTGSYQIAEDMSRGDRTLATALGIRGSFRFALICMIMGGTGAIAIAAARFSFVETLLLIPFIGGLLLWIQIWGMQFEKQTVMQNYRTTMRLYAAITLPLLIWIGFRLLI